MTDDFEHRLATLLTEQVDHELGPQRPAPPFRSDVPAGSRRPTRWLAPMLAAACVALLVGGGVTASVLLSSSETDSPRPGTSLTDHPASPSADPTPSAASSAATPSSSAPASSSTVSDYDLEPFGEAQIAVPAGWRLTVSDPVPVRVTDVGVWRTVDACLTTIAPGPYKCSIIVQKLVPPVPPNAHAVELDTDARFFGEGDPPQDLCDAANSVPMHVTETAADAVFGGRAADKRQWERSCGGVIRDYCEQFAVMSASAWSVVSEYIPASRFAAVDAAMRIVTDHSVLPPATGGVRYFDRGILRSVTPDSDGVEVAIDRVWVLQRNVGSSGRTFVDVNNNPATYRYRIPLALWRSVNLQVGQGIVLQTDGSTVIALHEGLR